MILLYDLSITLIFLVNLHFLFAVLFVVGVSVTLAALYSICACHNARKTTRFLLHRKNRGSGVTSLRSPEHQLLGYGEDDDDEF